MADLFGKRLSGVLGLFTFSLFLFSLFLSHAWAQGRGDASQGQAIYQKYCSSCHGRQGEGLGPSSGVSSFSDRKTLANKSDQELFEKITRGGRGSGMPAWEGILSEQDRWNTIAYIRSLGRS